MKKFWLILPMLFALTLSATHVEAKKFGGGKSFGKMFQTKPSPAKKAPTKDSGSQQQKKPSAGGLGKGLLGGLLAGGLIAALMGGAFEGIQIMDIILLAVVAFVLMRLFKAMMQSKASAMQPQAAYSRQQFKQSASSDTSSTNIFGQAVDGGSSSLHGVPSQQDATFDEDKSSGFGQSDSIPFNLPEGFDINNFLSGAREHYRIIQQAWNEAKLDTIKEYVSEELYEHLEKERAELAEQQHTEVMFVDAELVRADQSFGIAELSIKFSGRYRDQVENIEEDITDIWHLQRDTNADNAPWLIVGIEA
jgi:predicted lipid-binding transport protein (Tim44 family)